jgi:carbon-monoxide dehydrogenase medium subunit
MKSPAFDYLKPVSLAEAWKLLAEHGDDARILAGGQSLIATLSMRLSAPRLLIDINGLDELRGVAVSAEGLRIGALTRHAELLRSPIVAEHAPLLARAVGYVAHPAVRNRGTIGGNIAMADPASEIPACVVALDARINVAGAAGERQIAARDFFTGPFETAMTATEILTAVEIPAVAPDYVYAFREFARRRGDYATTGLAVHAERDGARFKRFVPVFFGVAQTPILASRAAAELTATAVTEQAIANAQARLDEELEIDGDIHASAAYKRHLARYFLGEAVRELHD